VDEIPETLVEETPSESENLKPAQQEAGVNTKKTTGGLKQKQLGEKKEKKDEATATKGAITSSEQQRIDALRSRLQQKGAQKTTETPL
jgi:hypothetical protein